MKRNCSPPSKDSAANPDPPNYLSAQAAPSTKPKRNFCAVCGFPSKYTCVVCGARENSNPVACPKNLVKQNHLENHRNLSHYFGWICDGMI